MTSVKSVSVSIDSEICEKMTEEGKCYKNYGDSIPFNYVCMNLTSSNSSSMIPFCGTSTPIVTPYKSEICPLIATSKIKYHQCYNTVDLGFVGSAGYDIVNNKFKMNSQVISLPT